MNVYIASFMLLLFNAVGVSAPAAAMATESAGNEVASEAELTAPSERDNAAGALVLGTALFAVHLQGEHDTVPVWPVLPVRSTKGDKLEHEEGAP